MTDVGADLRVLFGVASSVQGRIAIHSYYFLGILALLQPEVSLKPFRRQFCDFLERAGLLE